MTLKHIGGVALVAATALAFAFTATVSRADYNGGGPVKMKKMCWQATDGIDHGFWKKCPKPEHHAMKTKKKKAEKKK